MEPLREASHCDVYLRVRSGTKGNNIARLVVANYSPVERHGSNTWLRVELTDLDGVASYRLSLSDDGKLRVVPI